jgi:type I restriction enzyme S subunit
VRELALPRGWAWGTPPALAAEEKYSLGIGPFGSSLKVSDYTDNGVPLIFVRNIRSAIFCSEGTKFVSPNKAQDLAPHTVRAGDVLVTKMGDPPGDSALYPADQPDAILTADCIKWRLHPLAGSAPFFVHAIRTRAVREQILGLTRGVAQRKVSLARFATIRVPVAPAREQHRIVEALDSHLTRLDDAVATLERVQRNLKRYRASVLKAAVEGRLVPTEAELARAEGRDYEPASVLLERILAERRRRWGEAELARMKARGQAPKDDKWKRGYEEPLVPPAELCSDLSSGWVWATLDMVTEVTGGITKGQRMKAGQVTREVPYLRVANVQRGYLDLSSMKTIQATPDQIDDLRLAPGDILFNEGGDRDKLGRGWIWRDEIAECIHQNHVFRARPVSPELVPEFISWYGNTAGQRYFLEQGKQTTNLASINLTKLRHLPLPVPPLAEQLRIRDQVEALLSVAVDSEQALIDTKRRGLRLRQAILKWAFEGKLVEQDPNDEPAAVLLDRIRAEKAAAGQRPKRDSSRRTR